MQTFFPLIDRSKGLESKLVKTLNAALGILMLHTSVLAEEGIKIDPNTLASVQKGVKSSEVLPSEEIYHNTPSLQDIEKKKDTYTINFNNVAIDEYIRFTSKVTNLNFIFNEADVKFNVTIVSEEPVTPHNVVSILIQILRINGLIVLEQDGNLLITRVRNVSQLATVISSDLPATQSRSPLVTRVFRIKNARLETVASVIRPMLSDTALLEVSSETKQLIVTDITTNVDKISSLLAALDAPHSPLEVKTYAAQYVDLQELIQLTTQIISPFAEGNTLLFVPQRETGTIFIISTPHLVERSLTVLEDLDHGVAERKDIASRNLTVFLYALQHKSGQELLSSVENLEKQLIEQGASQKLVDCLRGARWMSDSNSILFLADDETLLKLKNLLPMIDTPAPTSNLQLPKSSLLAYKIQFADPELLQNTLDQMAENLQKAAQPDYHLIDTLTSMKYIKESHSLVFTGDNESLEKLKSMLQVFDIAPHQHQELLPKSGFFAYKIQFADPELLQNTLDQMAENLQKAAQPDYHLIDTLTSMKYIKESHSLVFTGDNESLEKLKSMLQVFDIVPPQHQELQFLIYHPKKHNGEELKEALEEVANNLKSAGYGDPAMAQSIASMQWTPASNTMIFSGSPATLARIHDLLEPLGGGVDEPVKNSQGESSFYLYKLQNASGNIVIENLKRICENLKDSRVASPDLITTLQEAKWIKDNNAILIVGPKVALDQAQALLKEFDVASSSSTTGNKSAFFIYKPIHQAPQTFIEKMKNLGTDLSISNFADNDLLNTITSARYVESTGSVLFTGTSDSLNKIKEIIDNTDVVTPTEAQIQRLGQYTFLIYKVQHLPAPQLIASLKGLTIDLQRNSAMTPEEADAINSLKYIKETNSLLLTGSAETLKKIELIIKKFDVPSLSTTVERAPIISTFVVYTPREQPGDELIKILEDFKDNLVAAGVINKSLFDAITNLKWVPRTCSLIISGDPDAIARVEDLLKRFDISTTGPHTTQTSIDTIQNTSFLIYKLQYHQGNEILTALKQIGTDLAPGTSGDHQNLLHAINSLQWIRVTNSLLASGEGDTLTKLRDLVQNLDVPLRQVFIEVLVVETDLSNTQNFGLQWGGKLQFLNRFVAGTGNFPLSSANSFNSSSNSNVTSGFQTALGATPLSTSNIPFVNGFDLGVIGDIIMHKGRSFLSLGSLVNALQTDTDSTIILNPKIITQDNQTSTVFVGSNIPYIGSLVTTSSQILSSSSNIEYRDIGFNLTVTPTIGNNDVVTLDISNDISAVVNQSNIGQVNVSSSNTNQITGITTSHTSMTTKVHVPNKHFVVLSGMINDSKTRYKSAIPCLGGLPVIGAVFSENDRVNSKHNVLIFMRPHIINTYEEYQEITDHQEHIFKNAASLPVLKEELDAGIDMVKRAEDE